MTKPLQRSFNCRACQGIIYIPYNLPVTVAPCPHCGVPVSSPPPLSPEDTFPPTHAQAPASEEPSTAATVVIPQARLRPMTSSSSPEPDEPQQNNRQRATSAAVSWFVALLLLAIVGVGSWMLWQEYTFQKSLAVTESLDSKSPSKITPVDDPDYIKKQYYLKGWQTEAEATLLAFLMAKTPEEKARYVIGGMATLERLRNLHGEKIMRESLTSTETFYGINVKGESEKTNIFLMTHHRPEQFCMSKFFRPLISSEKLHGVEEIDPLTESLSNINHFTMPRYTIQAYFKKTDQGMLLDWDVYAQTRFQSLKKFMEQTSAGDAREFRVLLYHEAISSENRNNKDYFYYRVCDPAHIEDNFLISQKRDSPELAELSKLHVVGSVSQLTKIETATVILEHDGNGGTFIKKFICWEFAGLGGVPKNLHNQGANEQEVIPVR